MFRTTEQKSNRLTEIANEVAELDAIPNRSAADNTKINALGVEFNELEAEVMADNTAAAMRKPGGRRVMPDDLEPGPRPYGSISGGMRPGSTKGSNGFVNLGDFVASARKHSLGNHDARILNAPTTFGSEGQASDGGFALPPDFRATIMKQVMSEESLLSYCDQQTTSSNSLTLPLDSVTPWDTSAGVQVSWVGEGAALPQSKPQLGGLECKTGKLSALCPLTDETLTDVPSMTNWLSSKVPDKITSALNEAIVNGSGVGRPQGLMKSPALITQAAESGQGANTITFTNVIKMWSRLYAKLRRNAVWLITQDAEAQLQSMVVSGGALPVLAYLPPTGLSGSPFSTLMGRPVIPVEACQALGTAGDIILCDLTQYLAVLKSQGMRFDTSIHLYFDTDTTALRFVLRVGGQSYWPAPITRSHASNSLSMAVCLSSTRT